MSGPFQYGSIRRSFGSVHPFCGRLQWPRTMNRESIDRPSGARSSSWNRRTLRMLRGGASSDVGLRGARGGAVRTSGVTPE